METQYICRWDCEPVGFVHRDAVYDFQSEFLGWIEPDGSVWAAATGKYLGLRPYSAPLDQPPSVQVPQPRPPRPRDGVWIDGI